MADITASTALRDYLAGFLAGSYYFVTLHSSIAAINAASVYAASGINELPTANGYTAGGFALTPSESGGVIDLNNAVWTTSAGETLTAAGACIWVNDANTIAGASLVSLEDNPQTASNGGAMTFTIVAPITIPTPS